VLGEGFCWGLPSQDFSWSRIERVGDGVELISAPSGEVGALWKVLAQHAVCVLVGGSLPGTVRVCEEDWDAGVDRERRMVGELLAAVPGERSAELIGKRSKAIGERVAHGLSSVSAQRWPVLDRGLLAPAVNARQMHQHCEPCRAFHDGADCGSFGADDHVAFPMPGHGAVVRFGWSLADHDVGADVAVRALLSTRTRNT